MSRPVVLCFSGHDPSGGAGIQADIETIASHHCHAAGVITALTEQDSRNVKKTVAAAGGGLDQPSANRAGRYAGRGHQNRLDRLGGTGRGDCDVLQSCPRIPVVLDPVLAAGGGSDLAGQGLIDAINNRLLPLATVLTPNANEARRLTGLADLDACGKALRHSGAEYVLITGADEDSELVHNRLYLADGVNETFNWERLPHSYHGSGCTLASAIAALLAQGLDPFSAISEAQDYTWQSLAAAYRPGRGQHNPERFFGWNHETSPPRPVRDHPTRRQNRRTSHRRSRSGVKGRRGAGAIPRQTGRGWRRLSRPPVTTVPQLPCPADYQRQRRAGAGGRRRRRAFGPRRRQHRGSRAKLGADAIIGVSCYNDIARATAAVAAGADYVAFGRFFPSGSKPLAAPAEIGTLREAKRSLPVPIVAIGGILPENAGQLLAAGADLLAVIGGVFDGDPFEAARRFRALF